MSTTDALVARYAAEIESKQQFIDGLVEDAESKERDLSGQEMELITRSRDRMKELGEQLEPLRETARIATESRTRTRQITEEIQAARGEAPKMIEYRSAGAYILDYWKAGLGAEEATHRLDLYNRAAAHQITTDNPGLLPEAILGPVLNFIDAARPCVNALGPRQLPSGSFARPKVTQNTQVAVQATEKTELVSRKMTISKLQITASTFGGYVNVSRQDIDWTQPGIMDLVLNDLAAQYAVETENFAVDNFTAAAGTGPTIPTGVPTAAAVAGALWTAAGTVHTATKGQGQVIAVTGPDMLGSLGPLFPPVNPQNAQSSGFSAGSYPTGPVGNIAGIPIYVSPGMAALTMLVMSTAAAEVYEDRIGSLQVVEPSVLGVQVAYAGYFAASPVLPAGIVKVVKTP